MATVPRLPAASAGSLRRQQLAPNRPCILTDGTAGWGARAWGDADAALTALEAIAGSDATVRWTCPIRTGGYASKL